MDDTVQVETSDIVHLNVGGHIYTTSRSTLTKYDDSMLGSMFSDRMPTKMDDRGNYVIDGDGKLFRYILNFLRRSKLTVPDGFKELDMLADEADFYQISELIDAIAELKMARDEELRKASLVQAYEFLEVEFECANGQYIVFAAASVLEKIPSLVSHYKDLGNWGGKKRVEEYGLSLPRGTRTAKPIDRIKLFREITDQGFEMRCASSSGGDERSTDRWTFCRCVPK
ncbi:BTB/POZ domain-containing protein KCTD6-like [Saccoglossus kowalevskii]|uniref:BTB/POZ domain-containing protein KCTD6-like n=1 Tax=Saccoglossus kowalevskii TaxID=10224 RepID=A0ABM0GRG8_SACKO|nr:PREDICTED: BTB/POZ domain-containing protein KCTD6-like [Saccoglossus kowalevskii]